MKTTYRNLTSSFVFLALFSALLFSSPAKAFEDWKGNTVVQPYEFGALTGMSLYGSQANYGILGTAAYLLKDKGWAQDLDNRIWAELEMGPTFFSTPLGTHTGLQYSLHIRWDFTLNEYWTFYGLGGLGGFALPSALGSSFTIHPRFGAGAEYQTKTALMFRAEVSEDFTGVGVAFNF
jgi:hypothetical protein